MNSDIVLSMSDVDLIRDHRTVLHKINWRVNRGERWVLLGPNGSGKTTLCRLASMYIQPTRGTIDVLGERLGNTDTRTLRHRIGLTSSSLDDLLQSTLRVEDVVVTGKYGALTPNWHSYSDSDRVKARKLLTLFGCYELAQMTLDNLSSGERQRVMLARTLMNDPELWLLDEPTAGLDLGGRERLIELLGKVAINPEAPTTVMVTHHVDEIPNGFTHALLLSEGKILAAGEIDNTLTADLLSACFGIKLKLERRDRRWLAWASQDLGDF